MEHIILIGHGSPKKSANNLDVVAELLQRAIGASCVKTAYLQFVAPEIMDAIKESAREGATKIILHPFFLSSGMHVTKDIPDMIEEAQRLYPNVEFIYTEPLGIHPALVSVIIDRIKEASFKEPLDIEKRSFEMIDIETELKNVPPDRLPIVKRVIHATADFEFKDTLKFHPSAIEAGLYAIKSGMSILTDVEMVKTGINKRLAEMWDVNVMCNIVSVQSNGSKTRAETGIEEALSNNPNIGIVAIGNAPTALLKAIEIIKDREGFKPLVIGVPVGFVRALESKAQLSKQDFPFITNLSRKGGSAVAVAIVNALLKIASEGE